jgi:hypothetical protein
MGISTYNIRNTPLWMSIKDMSHSVGTIIKYVFKIKVVCVRACACEYEWMGGRVHVLPSLLKIFGSVMLPNKKHIIISLN